MILLNNESRVGGAGLPKQLTIFDLHNLCCSFHHFSLHVCSFIWWICTCEVCVCMYNVCVMYV